MGTIEIIVGNIGSVYIGSDDKAARRAYREYVDQSKSDYGRAAGESVTWLQNGEVKREHTPMLWDLYWSPEGKRIACRVQAPSMRAAIRKAPMPYRKYKGEIYAQRSED